MVDERLLIPQQDEALAQAAETQPAAASNSTPVTKGPSVQAPGWASAIHRSPGKSSTIAVPAQDPMIEQR